jgi:pimeloyl-ACP methyl ester carboxylesterase
MIAPYIALPLFLNRHVNYRGYATYDYPLQDIYYASDYGLNEKQLYLTTEDGYNIWVSEIYTEKPKAVIIYLSGIVQPSVTYFYGHAKFMQDNGYSSILLEVRGHGKSDGKQICLGYEEVKDVQAVVDYINSDEKYQGVPIVLQGVSMGGAIAVNSFGQINDIDALIAMSAYSSFEDAALDIMSNYYVPEFIKQIEKPFLRSALHMIFGKEKVDTLKPLKQIEHANGRPVFLIACKDDKGVPVESTYRLKKAYEEAEIWIRNSWEHFIVLGCDFKNMAQDTEYCNKILDFLERKLP